MPKLSFASLIFLSLAITPIAGALASPESTSLLEADHLNLSQVETKFFGHAYKNESDFERIQRLEKFVFGSPRLDAPLKDRLNAVVKSTRVDTSSHPVTVPMLGQPVVTSFNSSQTGQCPTRTKRTDLYHALYPRVTQIEELLLGQSHADERIEDRLDRLEIKSFGKRSLFPDLGSRVDFLADYSRAFHPSAYRMQEPELLNVSYTPNTASATEHQPFFGVVDQIELLEKRVYGSIHANKTIQRRVEALEELIYGKSTSHGSDEISARVSRLWVTFKTSGAGQIKKNT